MVFVYGDQYAAREACLLAPSRRAKTSIAQDCGEIQMMEGHQTDSEMLQSVEEGVANNVPEKSKTKPETLDPRMEDEKRKRAEPVEELDVIVMNQERPETELKVGHELQGLARSVENYIGVGVRPVTGGIVPAAALGVNLE